MSKNKLTKNHMIFLLNYIWHCIQERNIGEFDDTDLLNNISMMWLSILEEITELGNNISDDDWAELEDYFEQRLNESGLVQEFIESCQLKETETKEMN